jgi:uncharacterized protein YaeQ
MALNSSIYKINVSLSNLNTHYYDDFKLTVAKHPSENESRMMYRLLSFLYCAHEDLEFCKGLSSTDEPELWQKGHSGEIIQWIELGLPTSKRIRQALGKSQNVKVFTYHSTKSKEWAQEVKSDLRNNKKLEAFQFEVVENGPIDKFVSKKMNLSCLLEDKMMYLGNDHERIGIQVLALSPE